MAPKDVALKHAVITSYREDLRNRYSLENCRRFAEFSPISEDKLNSLRDYFLDCIYPDAAERDKLDDAFDRMGDIIRSPKRLAPLMLLAAKSVWRLGLLFPSAVSAGAHTLEAYLETRRLESKLIEIARKRKLNPEQIVEYATLAEMVAKVPEREIIKFRGEVLALFRALSNVKLLAATVEIMDNSRRLMEDRSDLYHERELAGFTLGYEVLRKGLALFQRLREKDFPAIIEGIEAVELDWYDRIKSVAAAQG